MRPRTRREGANAKSLSKRASEWCYGQSIKTPQGLQSPMLDLVGRANLKDLPPATIINAEIDPLRSEGELLARKLRAAGIEVHQETYKGMTHEFFGMNAVVADAERAQMRAARDLKAALSRKSR